LTKSVMTKDQKRCHWKQFNETWIYNLRKEFYKIKTYQNTNETRLWIIILESSSILLNSHMVFLRTENNSFNHKKKSDLEQIFPVWCVQNEHNWSSVLKELYWISDIKMSNSYFNISDFISSTYNNNHSLMKNHFHNSLSALYPQWSINSSRNNETCKEKFCYIYHWDTNHLTSSSLFRNELYRKFFMHVSWLSYQQSYVSIHQIKNLFSNSENDKRIQYPRTEF